MPAALCASHTASQGVSTACWVVSYLAPKSYIITCFLGPLLATGSQMRFSGRVSSEMQLGVRSIYCGRKGEEAGLSRGKVKLLFRPPKKSHLTPWEFWSIYIMSKLTFIWSKWVGIHTPTSVSHWMWAPHSWHPGSVYLRARLSVAEANPEGADG